MGPLSTVLARGVGCSMTTLSPRPISSQFPRLSLPLSFLLPWNGQWGQEQVTEQVPLRTHCTSGSGQGAGGGEVGEADHISSLETEVGSGPRLYGGMGS